MIIAFYGPDGAGKTTIAKAVAYWLYSRGYRVSIVRLREHHLLMYPLVWFLQKTGLLPSTGSPRELDYSFASLFRKSIKLVILIEWFNAFLWIILNIWLRRLLGYIVVAERSVPDFIVSMRMISLGRVSRENTLFKILDRVAGHGKIVSVYLYARPDILVKRKSSEKLSIAYISYLLAEYSVLSKKYGSLAIDTSRNTVCETTYMVIKHISKALDTLESLRL